MSVKILCVAGARPNVMKVAPLMRMFQVLPGFTPRLVHTGQHYDAMLSEIFFNELGIVEPESSSKSDLACSAVAPRVLPFSRAGR